MLSRHRVAYLASAVLVSAAPSFAQDFPGKPVRIVFSAGDVGDSIFDTAVLIDRIEIKK